MKSSSKRLLATLKGEKTDRPPFWFMRQAGRYLPEYRELREHTPDFLSFCYSPDIAMEATLQPIRRFGMDGAIIFSDILVVPHALGAEMRFEGGVGPVLSPIRDLRGLERLRLEGFSQKLAPVYTLLAKTRAALSDETALIGFVGAPWTLACYVIEGRSGSDFAQAKAHANDPEFFPKLMALLTEAVTLHAKNQIRAGAEVIQIFDSWAGLLGDEQYALWSETPARKIIAGIRSEFPDTPVIAFPRRSGEKFLSYAKHTGAQAISFDDSVPLDWVKDHLQPQCVVQGCLSPELLAGEKEAMLTEARRIVSLLGDKAFVFNLGHGILPHTPLGNMQALCDLLKRGT